MSHTSTIGSLVSNVLLLLGFSSPVIAVERRRIVEACNPSMSDDILREALRKLILLLLRLLAVVVFATSVIESQIRGPSRLTIADASKRML